MKISLEPRRSVVLLAALLLPVACSSKSAAEGAADGGSHPEATNADAGPPPAGTARDVGTLADYENHQHDLAGATVTEGSVTGTTDSSGKWSLDVPLNTPLGITITLPTYTTTHLPEIEFLGGDNDWGLVAIPDLMTFQLGQEALPGYDPTTGVVYLVVKTLPSCASVAGGTVAVNAPSGVHLMYFKGLLPAASQTSFLDQTPVAVLYNVPVGAQLDVTVTHPSCTQVAFPATVGTVKFTGNVVVEAGNVNSVLQVYLQ